MRPTQALVFATVVCGVVLGAPQKEGYSYPEPVNGLYLPPPPDEGGPINPGGSNNYETGIKLPPAPTTRRPTTRRPTTRRPTTTRRPYRPPTTVRPTYRPTTRRPRPTYRPVVTTPKSSYIPPNLIPEGSGPPGSGIPFPTTRRPIVTTRRPIVTTRRPIVTTRRPIVTTRRPIVTTRRPIVTTRRPIVTTRRPIVTTRRPIVTTRRPSTTRRPVILTPPPPGPGAKNMMMHMSRPYEFGYDVQDDSENNSFSQKETSDGMIITGEYRWDMPDGRTQIVTYLADWAKGYYADVRYE